MARKIGEVDLDLNEEVLEGFERYYNLLNVLALEEAKRLGHVLPRVDVVLEGEIYRLVFGVSRGILYRRNYGGHSRAVVALQGGGVLSCNLYDGHRKNPDRKVRPVVYRPIGEMSGKRIDTSSSMSRLKGNLGFFPKEIREKFIRENKLIMNGDILRTREDYENPTPF